MKNKSILLINKSLCIGGIESVVQNQYTFFKQEHRVDLLLFKRDNQSNIPNDEIDYFDEYSSIKNYLLSKEKKYDLIICHAQSERICKIVKSIKTNNILFVLHGMHSEYLKNGNLLAKYFRLRRKKALYNHQNLIAVSDVVKEDILSIGVKPKKITTIYNPFDEKKIERLAQEDMKHPITGKYIVWVGRIAKVKNLLYLIEVYKYFSKDYMLVIVGDGDKKIIEDITTRAIELKISDRILFTGSVKNPYPYIKNASFMLLTSISEGFGLVLVEALLLKIASYSTDIPAARELLLKNYKFGLIQASTHKDFADKVRKNIKNGVDIDMIRTNFSSEISISKYLNYFSDN